VSCTAVPTSQAVSNITLTSADLSFTGTVNAASYVIRFKALSAAWSAWEYDTLTAPTVTLSKTGLTANTGYHWQVHAVCDVAAANISGWSGYQTFNTLITCITTRN
jgi:hypothetical protein